MMKIISCQYTHHLKKLPRHRSPNKRSAHSESFINRHLMIEYSVSSLIIAWERLKMMLTKFAVVLLGVDFFTGADGTCVCLEGNKKECICIGRRFINAKRNITPFTEEESDNYNTQRKGKDKLSFTKTLLLLVSRTFLIIVYYNLGLSLSYFLLVYTVYRLWGTNKIKKNLYIKEFYRTCINQLLS